MQSAPWPTLEGLSLRVSFPPSQLLIFVFRVAIKTMVNYSTHTLEFRNPRSSWSVHKAFLRHGAPLTARSCGSLLSEAPRKASCFPSKSRLVFSFLNHPPLSLIISIGCCPNSTHPEKMKPAILKLIPENSPQAAAGWVEWGLSETWGCTFYIINQNKTFSLQKTKEKKIYIYRPE